MADHRAATQTRYPWRAVARTAIAVVFPLIAGAPLIYQAATQHDPAAATGWSAAVLGVAGAITRVMALPLVNDFLTKIGLGAEPKEPPHD